MSLHRVPVIECMYGWGYKVTLYQDRLEANGTIYLLSDLVYLEPVYLHFMGISSIRLKLFFKDELLVLRGMMPGEPVHTMIAYLSRLICSPTDSTIDFPKIACDKAGLVVQQPVMASSQSSFWEYNEEEASLSDRDRSIGYTDFFIDRPDVFSFARSPGVDSLQESTEDSGITEGYEITKRLKQVVLSDLLADDPCGLTGSDLLELYGQLILPDIVYLPEYIEYRAVYHGSRGRRGREAQNRSSFASPLLVAAAWRRALELPESKPGKKALQVQLERRQQRLKWLQMQYELRVFGFSVEGLMTQLQQGELPCIELPIQLLPGEIAHYRTDATLCDEPDDAMDTERRHPGKYRIKDRGSFILTSSRILYLGRKRRMLLSYEQLLHVSRWHGFVVLTMKNFRNRQLFEMRRPLECTIYLEALLQRYWAVEKVEKVVVM